MPALVFDTCCGCINLRTGCLIIGYLNLVGELLLVGAGIAGAVGGGVVAANGEDAQAQQAGVALVAVSAVMLVVFLFALAFTIVLLVGIHKNKRGHVKAYLIVTTVCMVIAIITVLASFVNGNVKNSVSTLISLLINIYFLLVIRSYYYKMDEMKPPAYNTA